MAIDSLTSDLAAPQAAGTTITFTANASGGSGGYEDRWVIFDGAAWTVAREWQAGNIFAWTPPTPHPNYRVGVWVRDAGQTSNAPNDKTGIAYPINVRRQPGEAEHQIALRVSNIGICYRQRVGMFRSREFWALDDVCFDLKKGEALGLVGRNGAGKSSLLRVLARIVNPDRGQVETFEHSVALLGLQLGFNHNLSGRDNTVMNAMLQGVKRKTIESKLSEVEEFAGLDGFFDQPVRTYSAGMKARLRFAIAIQANPDILLVDEVLGVGDAPFRNKSAEIIHERIRSDQTVLVVSHNTGTLKGLCDRVVWIEDGKTKMIGKTAEVLASYEKAMLT